MHHFLRSIGFSRLRNLQQLNIILEDVIAHPTTRSITTIGADTALVQLTKELSPSYGISLIGEYDQNDHLIVEHYFPYIQ